MTYKIPLLRKDINNTIDLDMSSKKFINLPLLHLPICVTIAYKDGITLVDPSLKEEKVSDGLLVTVANRFNQICYMHTFQSPTIESCQVSEIIYDSKKWVDVISIKMKEFQLSDGRECFFIFRSDGERFGKDKSYDDMDVDVDVDVDEDRLNKEKVVVGNKNKEDGCGFNEKRKVNILKIK